MEKLVFFVGGSYLVKHLAACTPTQTHTMSRLKRASATALSTLNPGRLCLPPNDLQRDFGRVVFWLWIHVCGKRNT